MKRIEWFPEDFKPADERRTAKNMGILAIGILTFVVAAIVVPDIIQAILYLKQKTPMKQKWPSKRKRPVKRK